MSDYTCSSIGITSFTSTVVTLKYLDLGLYKLKIIKEDNGE